MSPLQNMPLTEIYFEPGLITEGIEVLRAIKSLNTIGLDKDTQLPAAEFWRKFDAGELEQKWGKPNKRKKRAVSTPKVLNDKNTKELEIDTDVF